MIRGVNVGLRAVEYDDLEQLRDWRNIEDFRKNFREHREIGMFNQENWFKNVNSSPNDYMFSIVRLSDHKLLGAAGLLYTNWIIRSSDFSIYIGEDEEYLKSDGYGGEAVRLLLSYGFKTLNLNKIWMELYEFDTVKLNFFLKEMNFRIDGTLRSNAFHAGSYHDSYIISILSNEFDDALK